MGSCYESLNANYAGVFDGLVGYGVAPVIITIDVLNGYTQAQYPFYSPSSATVTQTKCPALGSRRPHQGQYRQ